MSAIRSSSLPEPAAAARSAPDAGVEVGFDRDTVQRLLAACVERTNQLWERRIADYARQVQDHLARLESCLDLAEELGLETEEEQAPAFIHLNALLALGVKFDPIFLSQMREVEQHAVYINSDEDQPWRKI